MDFSASRFLINDLFHTYGSSWEWSYAVQYHQSFLTSFSWMVLPLEASLTLMQFGFKQIELTSWHNTVHFFEGVRERDEKVRWSFLRVYHIELLQWGLEDRTAKPGAELLKETVGSTFFFLIYNAKFNQLKLYFIASAGKTVPTQQTHMPELF